jgi:MFS family permease
LYGLDSFAHGALPLFVSLLLLILGVGVAIYSALHFKRKLNPLFDLTIFSIPTYAISNLWIGTAVRTGINATPFLLPLFFQEKMQLSPMQTGAYLLVYFLGNFGMKTATAVLLRWFGFRRTLFVNGIFCGICILACGWLSEMSLVWIALAILFIAGLSRSLQYAALNSLSFADVPNPLRATGATLSFMFQQISLVLGVALSVLILNACRDESVVNVQNFSPFQWAFFWMGLCVSFASFGFLRLSNEAGSEVSGHGI